MNTYIEDKHLAKEIAEKVIEHGGKTYYVGGCVRDMLMGNEPNDIDIEVFGVREEELCEILKSVGELKEIKSGFDIFNLKDSLLDITLPRESDNDDVNPFISEREAAKRRDFTVNAVMKNVLSGEILDFFGGVSDAENKIIRVVEENSIEDDPLRVLRLADFCARFQMKPDEHTAYLAEHADLTHIKRERVFEEVKKALLKSEKPSVFFEVLREIDQLDFWFPELKELITTGQNPVWHPEGSVWNHTMLVVNEAAKLKSEAEEPLMFMLAALFHDLGKAVTTTVKDGKIISYGHDVKGVNFTEKAIKRLTNINKIRDYTKNMTLLHMRPNVLAAQNSSQKAYNKLFFSSVCPKDLLLLAKADHMGRTSYSDYGETENKLKKALLGYEEMLKKPFVTGKDLVKAGIRPGENFFELLKLSEKMRLSETPYESALKQILSEARKNGTLDK